MRPKSSDISYLWDMLDAACAIREFLVGENFDDYAHDRLLRGAVERHIEIIGEAARNVSADYRNAHPEIPRNKIIAQRHVLAMNMARSSTSVYGRLRQSIYPT
jgi:uncharacterized protein with HEPN domain